MNADGAIVERTSAGPGRGEAVYGALIEALALVASLLLLAMMLVICADVLTRNVVLPGLPRGIAWSNEVSELLLYLITLLAAPWLLREGRHIRVDIMLRVLPPRLAYACEWIADLLGLGCCAWMTWYGSAAAARSLAGNALSIKTLVMPEWWFIAPLPACFALLAIEFAFRMRRLAHSAHAPRRDAVSAA
ncbi:TRAP transporter small permease [Piscinibacter sp. XHJ-5]|uniref:TRAP transporter small permease n=1 Tax=Piscinibacter sp. XHJ-5 TaxID=3037797 RepID=UPI002452E02F|nr:TRAP transporter small permease [Piscinibacter sp. XHJ-5]